MTTSISDMYGEESKIEGLLAKFDEATEILEAADDYAKPLKMRRVLDTARRVMLQEGGCAALEERAEKFERAGLFLGSDWAVPRTLVSSLTARAFASPDDETVVIEALSELRLLAVAMGRYVHSQATVHQARRFLTRVPAVNPALLFTPPGEVERERQGRLALVPRAVLRYLADRIGYENVIGNLIEEIWRILYQRPIQVDHVKRMVTQISICQANPDIDLGTSCQGSERLVSSLYGPTQASREDPGLEVYRQRLETMDAGALQNEATGFARAMRDAGLVSPYHPILIRFLLDKGDHLLSESLGLPTAGRDCLLCYRQLVYALIEGAVHPPTAQAVYGLSLMLERGILYQSPVAPALWRRIGLPLSAWSEARLRFVFGDEATPRSRLLEGVLCMLGPPLGVGQGNNQTCQSARALSMWAYNDPDYLLQMVTWAARDDEIIMHFEGRPVSSRETDVGVAKESPVDLDAVSPIVFPTWTSRRRRRKTGFIPVGLANRGGVSAMRKCFGIFGRVFSSGTVFQQYV